MFKKYYLIVCLLSFIIFDNSLVAQVSKGDPKAVPVIFIFGHQLRDVDKGVGVNGSFNNWLGGVYPMTISEDKYWWKVTLDLIPSTYEYKFVTYKDTVKQDGVTEYFNDFFNPVISGATFNSLITVTDPMIYYFFPKNGTTLYLEQFDIRAAISVANSSKLDINRILFKLDNEEILNAASYYNPDEKVFIYNPVKSLPFGTHTAYLKVYNTNGQSAELTTTFTLATLNKRM